MKRRRKKAKQMLITTAIVVASMVTIGGGKAQAALQANLATHNAKQGYTGAALIKSIRDMETNGQTMGLGETIDASTLMPSSSSNGIDVHMMKSTEYGAVAILSASGFGNPKQLQDPETKVKSSTGNVTGVYMGDRGEWTAGLCSASTVGESVNTRYYDLYTLKDQTSAKVGDALGKDDYKDPLNPGCSGWHGGGTNWLYRDIVGFVRGDGGVFSFKDPGWANSTSGVFCGRGVAVVGENL